MDIVILILAGTLAGIFTGILGASAGVILVPLLLLYFEQLGVPTAHVAQLVVGTTIASSWLAICMSAWTNRHHIRIDKRLLLMMLINPIVGLLLVHFISPLLTGRVFKILFAILMLSLPFITRAQQGSKLPKNTLFNNGALTFGAGLLNGLGATFGSGGGILLMPYFRYFGFNMKTVMGHLMLTGAPTMIFFIAEYIWLGWGKPLPRWSAGYVYLPALLYVGIPTIISSKIATHWRHRMDENILRWIFIIVVIGIGLSLLIQNL